MKTAPPCCRSQVRSFSGWAWLSGRLMRITPAVAPASVSPSTRTQRALVKLASSRVLPALVRIVLFFTFHAFVPRSANPL